MQGSPAGFPVGLMEDRFGAFQFPVFRMERVVESFRTEYLLAANEDELFIGRQAEDFIRGQQLPPPDRVRTAEAGSIVRDVHGVQIPRSAFDFDGRCTDPVAEVFCSKEIRASEEYGRITGTEDLLPLIIGIS